jgi:hypothetical protein
MSRIIKPIHNQLDFISYDCGTELRLSILDGRTKDLAAFISKPHIEFIDQIIDLIEDGGTLLICIGCMNRYISPINPDENLHFATLLICLQVL